MAEIKISRIEKIEIEKTKLLDIKNSLDTDEDKYINDKLLKMQKIEDSLPDRIAKEGNITMKQYIKSLKENIDNDKSGFIIKEKKRIDNNILQLEYEITEINKEVEKDGN